jgi:hypothetical protein
MINSVTNSQPLTPVLGDQPDRRSTEDHGEEGAEKKEGREETAFSHPAAKGRNLRMVVENDAAKGGLIYKWVDRDTGEVVSEMSRDDLAKISADPSYSAGAWLDTTA